MRGIYLIAGLSSLALVAGCTTTENITDENGKAVAGAEVAPPPPPPPPPPSSQDLTESQKIIVTGSAIASPRSHSQAIRPAPPSYGFVPPVIVANDPGRERYDGEEVSPVKIAASDPVSTFSVDVDTGAYTNTRRFLTGGNLPPQDAVRTEEMINYFRYDYASPEGRDTPFTVNTDVARSPWNAQTRLLRIGLRGYDLERSERPASNLVFLLDVSGSMNSADKLPLVKTALTGLANQLTKQDRVSIVVYAGAAGLVLEPTNDARAIKSALDRLNAGGSTAGGAGLRLAYNIAQDNFIKGGVNRVIVATDGDFNVGESRNENLIDMIKAKRDSGITLTTLGFGTGNYNEALLEQVANHGNGNYAYIDSALEAKKVLQDEMQSTLFTIAKDVKIQVEFNPAVVSQYRLVGYENRALRDEDFDNDKVDAGDIGAGHQVTAIYEIVPAGTKGWIAPRRYDSVPSTGAIARAGEAAHVKLRYKMPDGETSKLIDFVIPASKLRTTRLPTGDFAFAASVAAFGQKLRGDPLMGEFDYGDIVSLAGKQDDYWRQEFVRLASLAGDLKRN